MKIRISQESKLWNFLKSSTLDYPLYIKLIRTISKIKYKYFTSVNVVYSYQNNTRLFGTIRGDNHQ